MLSQGQGHTEEHRAPVLGVPVGSLVGPPSPVCGAAHHTPLGVGSSSATARASSTHVSLHELQGPGPGRGQQGGDTGRFTEQ